MMIAEGVIAMIWAAAALAIYNMAPENLTLAGPVVLGNIASRFLGTWVGGVTVAAIIVLAITSGDTALRSSRLSLAEILKVDQVDVVKRVLTCLPLTAIVACLIWWSNKDAKSFNHLWNYFAWTKQLVSTTMLFTASVWMLRRGKKVASLVAILPACFMCMVVSTFILWAWPSKGQEWGIVPGGLPLGVAAAGAAVITAAAVAYAFRRGHMKDESHG
jgi:carbon starvation protein CstA